MRRASVEFPDFGVLMGLAMACMDWTPFLFIR